MADVRFNNVWRKWEALKAEGTTASAALANLSDSDLVMLLAADVAVTKPYERNVFATTLLNRLGEPSMGGTGLGGPGSVQ